MWISFALNFLLLAVDLSSDILVQIDLRNSEKILNDPVKAIPINLH